MAAILLIFKVMDVYVCVFVFVCVYTSVRFNIIIILYFFLDTKAFLKFLWKIQKQNCILHCVACFKNCINSLLYMS